MIGGFGSGKTSVRHLASEHLRKTAPWVVVVPVSAWPYESASALVTGILERVVAELADKAGWEALRHVPASYRAAIEGSAGAWGKVLRLLDRSRTPKDLLEEIDDIALAIGVRVVVWVEDLERFAPVEEEGRETPAAREKLEPVRALLHQLQELRQLTIVVATTRLDAGFDLEKLARFIETLPVLPPELVLRTLHNVRSEAMKEFTPGGLIDAVSSEQREAFDLQPDSLRFALRRAGQHIPLNWADALGALTLTPRKIKQGLREFFDIWEDLCGEVDVDHALGASLLRHAEPKVFQAFVSPTDALRFRRRNDDWWCRTQKALPSGCEMFLVELGVRAEQRQPVATLLQHLFGPDSREHPQGFGEVEPVDYWARFLSRTPITKEESDQIALRELRSFAANGSRRFLELSMEETAGSKIVAFESLLPRRKLLDLLGAQLRWIQNNRLTWPHGEAPPGVANTWAICTGRAGRGDWSAPEAFSIIDSHVQSSVRGSNLRLADWLLLRFATRRPESSVELLAQHHREEIRRNVGDTLLENFVGDPHLLAMALRGIEQWLLHRLCYGLDRMENPDQELPFPAWPMFVEALIAAAQSHPAEVLPSLAHFVTESNHVYRDSFQYEAKVDREAATRLFPNADEVFSLFAKYPDIEATDPLTAACLDALRAAQPPSATAS